jgi:hypothetical protein
MPVWHFTQLKDGFPPEDILRPAIVLAVVFTLILWFFRFAGRDWHRAGLWTMLPVIALVIATQSNALLAGLALAVLVTVFMERGKVTADSTLILNIFAVVLSVVPLSVVGATLFAGDRIDLRDASLEGVKLNERPSIVHIVLDGYSARDVAAQVYGHDNSVFEKALEEEGFLVMERAFTPHNQTLFAMTAVMNGVYLSPAVLPDIQDWKLRLRLGKTLTGGAVASLLRREGYQFAYTDNSFRPLRFGDGALRRGEPGVSLNSIESSLIATVLPSSSLATAAHNVRVRGAFAPENYDIPARPFFFYQHVITPHPPFSLTSDGGDRQTISPLISDASHFIGYSTERRRRYVEGYAEKLKFTNTALLRQMQNLPDGPIVVFIHGDHGGGSLFDHESLERSCAQERFATLFAVYSNIPQVQQAFSARSSAPFNLVNTYRILLSALSETEIATLPDTSFFNPWSEPRRLQPVPSDVRTAECRNHPLFEPPASAG